MFPKIHFINTAGSFLQNSIRVITQLAEVYFSAFGTLLNVDDRRHFFFAIIIRLASTWFFHFPFSCTSTMNSFQLSRFQRDVKKPPFLFLFPMAESASLAWWSHSPACYHEPMVHDHSLYFQLSYMNLYLLLPIACIGILVNASAMVSGLISFIWLYIMNSICFIQLETILIGREFI